MPDKFIQFHRPLITDDEINAVVATLKTGWLSMGPKTMQFENEFNNYVNSKYSVAVNSWTAAGHLVLEAIGLSEGDEVVVPTMTFPATAEIACYFKAKPILVDVDPVTMNMTPENFEKAITPRTKAVIPVHYAGQPCDMDEIMDIADKHNITVLEDAAHAIPSTYKGKKIGSVSENTCFSFYATKTLTTGEGGMICTKNEEIANRTKLMRLHGINRDAWKRFNNTVKWEYEVVAPGHKYNLTDIAASLGLTQLAKTEQMFERRKSIAEKYNAGFAGSELIELPHIKEDRTTSWYLYTIRLNLDALKIDRANFIYELEERGVGTGVHFMPVHRHQFYQDKLNIGPSHFEVAESVYEQIVSLPIYPGLKDEEVDHVINTTQDLLKKYKK
ncbi:MAG: DegT/DnrJ/EryC1/StrS family aminotransferase [Chlorobi bacterium]|nr:DegT/DnrJ/EryC1/StrS family aminotransferase [Chlorobiota bacterium]